MIPKIIKICDIQYILASLLREEVSIKDIMHVMERISFQVYNPDKGQTMLETFGSHTGGIDSLLQKLRVDLAHSICGSLRNEKNELHAIVIKNGLKWSDQVNDLNTLVETIINQQTLFENTRICVICPPYTRHRLFYALSQHIVKVTVLSHDEITPTTRVIELSVI
jgi:flagellar biosynthesis component FlhA